MNIDSKIIALVYEHVQLCATCGKEGQRIKETVYLYAPSNPKFDNNNIPVGWYSSTHGVYCSEKCFKQSISNKE
ncbi:hypothetical protein AAX06_06060 [Moraxella bovoculi]|uniref:MYM-type domain-containing protein n=1 Tax=Moraxella bovoculi TaxID=386891 RepID=A0AAC8T7Z9_9GAMM|nr:hypothetical protein [Moraxella bovoculi]AKG07792.1 hypothetical protein AAX06_06060 [Moraxella bovoculi]AKG11528.1 hypothetical protein AAX07_05460 [Moraxella bovoculi]AKG13495.1 hypothetical protein AAX11_04990 [Moraxella bovoculi]